MWKYWEFRWKTAFFQSPKLSCPNHFKTSRSALSLIFSLTPALLLTSQFLHPSTLVFRLILREQFISLTWILCLSSILKPQISGPYVTQAHIKDSLKRRKRSQILKMPNGIRAKITLHLGVSALHWTGRGGTWVYFDFYWTYMIHVLFIWEMGRHFTFFHQYMNNAWYLKPSFRIKNTSYREITILNSVIFFKWPPRGVLCKNVYFSRYHTFFIILWDFINLWGEVQTTSKSIFYAFYGISWSF